MPKSDRDLRATREEPLEGRMQVDPMLRQSRVRFGWTVAIAAAVVFLLVLLLATNRDTSDVAKAPPAQPPATTSGSGPMPPETQPSSARGTTNAPPASKDAAPAPAERPAGGQETSESGQ